MSKQREYVNINGNSIVQYHFDTFDRRHYDNVVCKESDGWHAWKTDSDSSQYGIWMHVTSLTIILFDKCDEFLITCLTLESFIKELHFMEEVAGPLSEGSRLTEADVRRISLNTNGIHHAEES